MTKLKAENIFKKTSADMTESVTAKIIRIINCGNRYRSCFRLREKAKA